MTSQINIQTVVSRDMKPENIVIEVARRERLTSDEREEERGERRARACLCASWELCICRIGRNRSRQPRHTVSRFQ